MTAFEIYRAFDGIFLWLTSAVVVTAVLALRPHLWRLWDNVVEWVTCPPSDDVKSQVESGEVESIVRGMTS